MSEISSELKVGDRVRILSLDDPGYFHSLNQGLFVGNTAEVLGFRARDGFVLVKTDNAENHEQATGGWFLDTKEPGWSFPASALEKLEDSHD